MSLARHQCVLPCCCGPAVLLWSVDRPQVEDLLLRVAALEETVASQAALLAEQAARVQGLVDRAGAQGASPGAHRGLGAQRCHCAVM